MKPVLFLIRKLLDRETKYLILEREWLAIKWAIGALQNYLFG